jgi:hypothetical protein
MAPCVMMHSKLQFLLSVWPIVAVSTFFFLKCVAAPYVLIICCRCFLQCIFRKYHDTFSEVLGLFLEHKCFYVFMQPQHDKPEYLQNNWRSIYVSGTGACACFLMCLFKTNVKKSWTFFSIYFRLFYIYKMDNFHVAMWHIISMHVNGLTN